MAVENIKVVSPERMDELIELIAQLISKYQKAEIGKGLSEQDFTTQLKQKLESITPDKYITEETLSEKVKELTGISLLRVDTYEALLIGYGTGEAKYKSVSTIYLVGTTPIEDEASGNPNVYEEYLYLGDKATEDRPYEKIGSFTTSVDLSGFVKREEIETMSNEDLLRKWNEAFPPEE